MKPVLPLLAAVAFAVMGPSAAAQSTMTPSKPAANTQQERMKVCNERASGKKGDERKEFMSACLSGKDEPKLNAQQQKMKDCNARAAGRSGDDRKKFMSECLKG